MKLKENIAGFGVLGILTVLVLLPHVGFEPGWGKVIHTFCQTRMAGQHGIVLPFDHQISNALGPVEANLLELLLCWLLGALLGLVLFVLNLTVNRSAGAICAAALAIFPLFVERAGWWMHYISPVSWASLSVVDLTGTTAFPSLGYALAVLAGGPIGVFTVIAAFFTGPLITAWNRFATLPLYRRFGILNREELAEERS